MTSSGGTSDTPHRIRVVIISGPTSAGKSHIAVELAKRFNGEIVSADSMQVYRGMDIGTGKPTEEEMQGIRHHLIDVIEPTEDFNVSRFREMADAAIAEIASRGKLPIIVGGTGFYISSLLYSDDSGDPGKDRAYKEQLRKIADDGGLSGLYDELVSADPEFGRRINRNDRSRIIRALEYHHTTGLKYSDYCDAMKASEPRYDASIFYLDCDRSILYRRMDQRVDDMVAKGLESEVRKLISQGVGPKCTSMNGIGYKEMAEYICGKISLEEAVRLIKSNTHHYAVRQSTWFRGQEGSVMVDCSDVDEALERISSLNELFENRFIAP